MKLCPNAGVHDSKKYMLSWLDRLLSWPWRPWKTHVTIIEPKFETVGSLVYCSLETFKKVKAGELPWPDGVTELDGR